MTLVTFWANYSKKGKFRNLSKMKNSDKLSDTYNVQLHGLFLTILRFQGSIEILGIQLSFFTPL